MDNVLRKFGLKKSDARDTEARQKLQRDLFAYNKCLEHGFPNKVSAMGYDSQLGLLGIGTKTGALRIFGAPGVEFSAHHKEDITVFQVILYGQGQVITLCSDNCLHLWEIGIRDSISYLEEVKALPLENKVKTVSASCLNVKSDQLLLGTESGHIFVVDLKTFKLLDKVIYQETIIHSAPDDFKVNPGAVEAIVPHPIQADQLLIGYNRGLIVLWDYKQSKAIHIYNASQQLESLSFLRTGEEFISSHGNGGFIIWNTADATKPKEQSTTPYGPFPCKAMSKLQWKITKYGEHMYIFSGAMPRASYGDRHTVTVMMQGSGQHVVFDFSSKVIDFFTICSADDDITTDVKPEYDDPHTLIVLAEEELVAIDLATDRWPMFRVPYLPSLHSSAITCTAHVGNVPRSLWNKICDAGDAQFSGYSTRDWPIQGGINLLQEVVSQDLLITGHEDGSLRFWDVSSTNTIPLYKLSTANMFGSAFDHGDAGDLDPDEEWPPFRKVGTYDPFSDDPRLAIQKIVMCPVSEMLVVGGTAGQVIVLQFEREERRQEIKQVLLNIIADRDNFVWKGHDALPACSRDMKFAAGFQPVCMIQTYPPAACTALVLHSEWQLVATGMAHGFGIVDYVQRRLLITRCTLNPTDMTGIGESTMSRRKSFKKSLRESFRRLRSRRSDRRSRPASTAAASRDDGNRMSPVSSPARKGVGAQNAAVTPIRAQTWHSETIEPLDTSPRPVERAIEARSADDVSGSIVRTLYFADTFLLSGHSHMPTMWAGTNAGTVFVYHIIVPANEARETEDVQCILAKEIHLKHHAPVISICVIDRNFFPLPAPLDVQHERARHPDMTGGHSVVICSEEQLKVFSLPSLGGRDKFKLTAHEGTKIRKVGFINFRSRSDASYVECNLVCLTNLGEVHVYSVPHLRRQLRAYCVKKDNIIGIVSSVFTQTGEGFFLVSPSEFVRFSVSAHAISRPMCVVRAPDARTRAQLVSESGSSGNRKSTESAGGRGTGGARKSTPTSTERGQPKTNSPASSSQSDGSPSQLDNTTVPPSRGTFIGEVHDDSIASGDTTADSVRVHISEDHSASPFSTGNNGSVSSRRLAETTGTRVMSTTTTTHYTESESNITQRSVTSSDASFRNVTVGSGRDEFSLDALLMPNTEFTEISDSSELEELRIVEEGDEIDAAINRSTNSYSTATTYNERSVDVVVTTTSVHHSYSAAVTVQCNNNAKSSAVVSCNMNSLFDPIGSLRSSGRRTNGTVKCNLNVSHTSEQCVPPTITITEALGDNITD